MKKITLISVFACLYMSLVAQNVAITDDNSYTADSSAMLDVKSINKGLLVPRVTTIQRTSISSPAVGLLVYDTDLKSFYLYNGTAWTNLTSGSPNALWSISGDQVYLTDIENNLGIGTANPWGRLEVKGSATESINTPIFHVTNSSGDTVFAVYPSGVRINVADDPAAKAVGSKGGFAVGGFSSVKGPTNDYLWVTPDSIRVYIEEGGAKAVGSKGGFAVGGFSSVKGVLPTTDYFNILGSGLADTLNPSQSRIFWYPLKEAFLAGRVLVESPDSIGTNSFSSGFESKAIGDFSQALGYHARSFGLNSTALGNYANATGDNSLALGDFANASGIGSFAIGSVSRDALGNSTDKPTLASGNYSFAFGLGAQAEAIGAFAIGNESVASNNFSIALGYKCTVSGERSIVGGYQSTVTGDDCVALGKNCLASGLACTAMGSDNFAGGAYSTALGTLNTANGAACTALGQETVSTGDYSVAMGSNSSAIGNTSFVMGVSSSATADGSVVFGRGLQVSCVNSFGIALNDQTGTNVINPNVMAILGGNVGIGLINPTYILEVTGTANLNSGIASGPALNVNNAEAISYNGTYFSWGLGGQDNYFADNVGIGVVDPLRDLHIKQTTASQGIRFEKVTTANYWDLGTGPNNNFQFYYNGTLMSDIGSATGAYNQLSDQRKKINSYWAVS